MLKKSNEKEAYLAPQWGIRVAIVERHILDGSPTDPVYGGNGEPGSEVGDDQYGPF